MLLPGHLGVGQRRVHRRIEPDRGVAIQLTLEGHVPVIDDLPHDFGVLGRLGDHEAGSTPHAGAERSGNVRPDRHRCHAPLAGHLLGAGLEERGVVPVGCHDPRGSAACEGTRNRRTPELVAQHVEQCPGIDQFAQHFEHGERVFPVLTLGEDQIRIPVEELSAALQEQHREQPHGIIVHDTDRYPVLRQFAAGGHEFVPGRGYRHSVALEQFRLIVVHHRRQGAFHAVYRLVMGIERPAALHEIGVAIADELGEIHHHILDHIVFHQDGKPSLLGPDHVRQFFPRHVGGYERVNRVRHLLDFEDDTAIGVPGVEGVHPLLEVPRVERIVGPHAYGNLAPYFFTVPGGKESRYNPKRRQHDENRDLQSVYRLMHDSIPLFRNWSILKQ